MGCLKSLIRKILIIALIIAFFMFGGYAFVKAKINEYQNPPKSEFIKTERNYGDFSSVSADFQLIRNFNIFGYKKISAKYLPTDQKITIFDLKDEKTISVNDFKTGEINKKIDNLLDKFKDSIVTYEDFTIIQKGIYYSPNNQVPYIVFKAKVKNVPFKEVIGTIACYSTTNLKAKNPSTKLVVSVVDKKAYNPFVVASFVKAIKF